MWFVASMLSGVCWTHSYSRAEWGVLLDLQAEPVKSALAWSSFCHTYSMQMPEVVCSYAGVTPFLLDSCGMIDPVSQMVSQCVADWSLG